MLRLCWSKGAIDMRDATRPIHCVLLVLLESATTRGALTAAHEEGATTLTPAAPAHKPRCRAHAMFCHGRDHASAAPDSPVLAGGGSPRRLPFDRPMRGMKRQSNRQLGGVSATLRVRKQRSRFESLPTMCAERSPAAVGTATRGFGSSWGHGAESWELPVARRQSHPDGRPTPRGRAPRIGLIRQRLRHAPASLRFVVAIEDVAMFAPWSGSSAR